MPVTQPLTRKFGLISSDECAAYVEKIHSMKDSWTLRDGSARFHTLGTASYLDAAGGRFEPFKEKAARTNPVLLESFGDLLEKVRLALCDYVGDEMRYDANLSYPGFHIFLAREITSVQEASLHFDLQYTHLKWDEHGGCEPETQISFTLPVSLPASGGGLRVWELKWQETSKLRQDDHIKTLADRGEPLLVDYENGVLAVHGGHHLHQIRPMVDTTDEDERITLQGHAIRCADGWVAYW